MFSKEKTRPFGMLFLFLVVMYALVYLILGAGWRDYNTFFAFVNPAVIFGIGCLFGGRTFLIMSICSFSSVGVFEIVALGETLSYFIRSADGFARVAVCCISLPISLVVYIIATIPSFRKKKIERNIVRTILYVAFGMMQWIGILLLFGVYRLVVSLVVLPALFVGVRALEECQFNLSLRHFFNRKITVDRDVISYKDLLMVVETQHNLGQITDEEYQAKRQEILKNM